MCRNHYVEVNRSGLFICPSCNQKLDDKEARNILVEIFGGEGGEQAFRVLVVLKDYIDERKQINIKVREKISKISKQYLESSKAK